MNKIIGNLRHGIAGLFMLATSLTRTISIDIGANIELQVRQEPSFQISGNVNLVIEPVIEIGPPVQNGICTHKT